MAKDERNGEGKGYVRVEGKKKEPRRWMNNGEMEGAERESKSFRNRNAPSS